MTIGDLVIKAKTSSDNVLWGARLTFWLVIAMMAYGLYAAYSAGQTMRATRQEQAAHMIAEEDRAFCEKFGITADDSQYAKCCRELATIRRKQADRDRRGADGLL